MVPRFHQNLYFATRALLKAGHGVSVISSEESPLELHDLVVPTVAGEKFDFEELRKIVLYFQPSVAILRESGGLSDSVARLLSRSKTIRIHYDLHSLYNSGYLFNLLTRLAQKKPARRITPVRGTKGIFFKDPFATYLPWPVGEAATGLDKNLDGPLRVLCVGKLQQPRKNQFFLLEAIRTQLMDGKILLTLVGDATARASEADTKYYQHLKEMASSFGGSVRLFENVQFSHMGEFYRSHDVCVLPARREPLGQAPLEGMAYGCLPILSDQCGSAGSIESGIDGFVFGLNNQLELQSIMHKLDLDRQLLHKMRARAMETASSDLSESKFVCRFEAMLK